VCVCVRPPCPKRVKLKHIIRIAQRRADTARRPGAGESPRTFSDRRRRNTDGGGCVNNAVRKTDRKPIFP